MNNKQYLLAIISLFWLVSGTLGVSAQTNQFTYQGHLTDGGIAPTGNYDLQFGLFDAAISGSQKGPTVTLAGIPVSDGIFTVKLDFGAQFDGNPRFLQISVKGTGSPNPYTTLSPRQSIDPAPYAIRSFNATNADTAVNAVQLGGVTANQYIQSTDPRLADQRPPTSGSSAYIQNNTNPQSSSNFNISGNGTAGGSLSATTINAVVQYELGGSKVLSVPGSNNTYVGLNAGNPSANSGNNSFFGRFAGQSNGGTANSFFGASAGLVNSTGSYNTFFGSNAGAANTTAINNAFFGQGAGFKNTLGHDNTFIGNGAGLNITTASNNTIVGGLAGQFGNGSNNAFFGYGAGSLNSGTGNTYLGYSTGGSVALSGATAIGSNAFVGQSNSIVLGGINGVNGATANTSVGIGTSYPNAALHIKDNNGNVLAGDAGCGSGYGAIGFGATFNGCQNYSLLGNGIQTILNGPDALLFKVNNAEIAFINSLGHFVVENLFAARELGTAQFSVALCINASSQLSYCSSSLRYKKDLVPFTGGLAMLNRLKPITFKWKGDDAKDIGFGAEDIAEIEPLLVTHNKKGEIEGVKYERISVILVNAIKEQQTQIEAQQKLISGQQALLRRQQRQLASLQSTVNRIRPRIENHRRKGVK